MAAKKTAAQTDAAEDEVITFTEAVTNIGNGYDTSTCTFTAPYDGLYHFHAVVLAGTDTGITPKLYKNSADTLVRGIGTDQSSQAIVSAFLSLTQGDEITIVNQNADDDISSFANGYHTHMSAGRRIPPATSRFTSRAHVHARAHPLSFSRHTPPITPTSALYPRL